MTLRLRSNNRGNDRLDDVEQRIEDPLRLRAQQQRGDVLVARTLTSPPVARESVLDVLGHAAIRIAAHAVSSERRNATVNSAWQ